MQVAYGLPYMACKWNLPVLHVLETVPESLAFLMISASLVVALPLPLHTFIPVLRTNSDMYPCEHRYCACVVISLSACMLT